jgi:hypothetical protein
MNDAKEGAFYIYTKFAVQFFAHMRAYLHLPYTLTKRPVVRAHYSKKAHHMF